MFIEKEHLLINPIEKHYIIMKSHLTSAHNGCCRCHFTASLKTNNILSLNKPLSHEMISPVLPFDILSQNIDPVRTLEKFLRLLSL